MQICKPRCPKGKLAKQICVTQKCTASPFICLNCSQKQCENSHRYCRTMQWHSALDMLNNYRDQMPVYLKAFMERVQKIYCNIEQKIKREVKIFREYLEKSVLSEQYQKLMYFLNAEQYDKITCEALSTVFSNMTMKSPTLKPESAEKFTLNEMKVLDSSIKKLLEEVEDLYKKKFTLLQKQIKENSKNNPENLSTRSSSQTKMPSSQSKELSRSRKLSQSNIIFKNSSVVLEKSIIKKFASTASTNFTVNLEGKNYKPELDYPKHINSRICQTATVLNYIIGTKVKEYKLLYRASQDNFEVQQFYRKMRNNYYERSVTPMTMILVKTQFGKVLGGVTKLKWMRQHNNEEDDYYTEHGHKQDPKGGTFFFSADLNERFKLIYPQNAIYCGKSSLGFGRKDLRIVNHSHKHSKNYLGFPDSFYSGQHLRNKKTGLLLSGSIQSSYFKIVEWEAFQVVFS